MAYEGETIRITAQVEDYNGEPILPSAVTTAVVNLYDGSGNYVFQDEPLTYATAEGPLPGYWFYDWENTVTGGWIAQCVFTGTNYEVFNYVSVKVRAPRIVPTGQPAFLG
jgi:hypothetical protein